MHRDLREKIDFIDFTLCISAHKQNCMVKYDLATTAWFECRSI